MSDVDVLVGRPAALTLQPFPHVTVAALLDDAVCRDLMSWLRSDAPWRYHDGGFYRQMECDLRRADLSPGCRSLLAPATLGRLRGMVEEAFDTRLAERMTIIGHKLLDDYAIGIHNDAPAPGMETHRLVLRLNRPEEGVEGGDLVFFRDRSSTEAAAVFPVALNEAVAFALSDRSYHAVRPVVRGPRYSVVFSFWTTESADIADRIEAALPEDVLLTLTRVLDLLGAKRVEHSGRTLLEHLVGTCQILRGWGCRPAVCMAGLFHSVYGTESFGNALVDRGERAVLRDLLSDEAEALVYRFSTTPHRALHHRPDAPARDDALTAAEAQTRTDLVLLDIANFIDQVHSDGDPAAHDPESVRFFRSLGATLPPAVQRSLADIGVL